MGLFDRLWARIRPRHWQDLQEDDLARYAAHGRAWWERWAAEWCLYRPMAWPGTVQFRFTRWPGRPGWKVSIGTGFASLYVAYRDQDEWGREYGFSIHHGCVWIDRGGQAPDASPKCLHVVDWVLGKHKVEFNVIEEREVLIPMPEGCYHGKATLKLRRDYRERFPFLTTRYSKQPWIDVDAGIPFDGKGENGWDCGGDALFGTGAGNTIEEAIGYVVARSLENRRRYGSSFAKQAGELPDDARIAPREAMRAEARS